MAQLRCHRCEWRGDLAARQACPRCGGTLLVAYEGEPGAWEGTGVWRYHSWLPVRGEPVSLGEGGTPLLRGAGVWLKNEAANPTLSFKDRPVAVAATIARAAADLATREGLSVELSAAAALAGWRALVAAGRIGAAEETVLILTGHASKDPPPRPDAPEPPLVAPGAVEDALRLAVRP